MSYRISRALVENSSEALDQIDRAIRRGDPVFFDIPEHTAPDTFLHDLHALLASAKFYSDMGYGHLRGKASVALDYDSGRAVIYPSSLGKWNKPGRSSDRSQKGQVTTGGTLRSAHDVYADFRNSDSTETRLRFRLPDDWSEEIEGMGGKTGEDLFRLACDSDGIQIGELTYHEEEDGTRWASCYAVKESITKRRQRSGRGGFDSLGQHYDKD